MKKFTFLSFTLVMLITISQATAQKVVVIGMNHSTPDGFSFVATENLSVGEVIYFTDNEYSDVDNAFTFNGAPTGEAVVKFTVTSAISVGNVVFVNEISSDVFSVTTSGGSGTAIISTFTGNGNFSLPPNGDNVYAYSDTDENPVNGITEIYSVLYTGSGENPAQNGGIIPNDANPASDYSNAIVVDGFPDDGDVNVGPNRVEYVFNPASLRDGVSKALLENPSNYLSYVTGQALSTVPFTNFNLSGTKPVLTISSSSPSVIENSGNPIIFTFSLSTNAATNITANFSVGGSATFTTDYTQSGAVSFSASSGTVNIISGSNSASVTVTPVGDSNLEPNETILMTLTAGTGYDAGSPGSATSVITNDDTSVSDPIVAITGLNHETNDGFSFVAAKDIPAGTTIYFTDNSFNKNTLLFGTGESVLSWTSPGSVIPAGQVIVATETATNVLTLTRSGGANAGSITIQSGDFATATTGETFYAYEDNDNDPGNGVTDIYAVLYTGNSVTSGGTIPSEEDPSGIYLNALVVDGFPATEPNRTEYDPLKRNVLVEAVDFKNTANWLNAQSNQVLSEVPFDDLKIVSAPELTTNTITIFETNSAILGGDITDGGSTSVTDRGVVYSSVNQTPMINGADVIQDANGTGTGIFSELITSLMPNTTYYVQAYATNSVGTSYGGVESFTTSFGNAIWNGSVSNDWGTSGNWSGGVVPNAGFNVFIPGDLSNYPTITASAECNNLIIESTESSTGSLLGQGNLTINGIVVVERFMTGNEWHMIASPVPGQIISEFLTTNTNIPTKNTDDRGMMDYNETLNNWNAFFTSSQPGNLASGKGFSLRTDDDDFVVFTGALETGTVLTSVTTNGDGWNCIGNPYSSAIYINHAADATNNFIDVNINELDPSYAAIYVWVQTEDAYSIINLGDAAFYAQLGQGFFAKAKTGASNLQFTTAMQTHQPTVTFKSGTVSLPEIKLIAKLDNHQSYTRIKFGDDMQTKLDVGYDAGVFKNGFDLYSQLVDDNGVDFGVQYLPASSLEQEVISLGLDSKYNGSVTFSSELTNLQNDYKVVLEDRLTNTFTPLNDGQVYVAQVEKNTQGKGRFFLYTSKTATGIGRDGLAQGFNVYSDNQKIYIKGPVQNDAEATLYDLMGRKIRVVKLEKSPLNSISTSDIKTGIYLLKIEYQGGSFTKKIPVNK